MMQAWQANFGNVLSKKVKTMMNLEGISRKHLNELEIRVTELLVTIRKAKLQNEPLAESLKALENQLGDARRKRFDESTPEYRGY